MKEYIHDIHHMFLSYEDINKPTYKHNSVILRMRETLLSMNKQLNGETSDLPINNTDINIDALVDDELTWWDKSTPTPIIV